MNIPVNEPLLDGNERRYLNECIDGGWISSEGPFVRKLEERLALRVDRRHAIAVCNGSAALDAAVAALDLERGDEVILPAFTIISCAAAIVRAGCVPVLVDSNPITWCMDVEQVAAKITCERARSCPCIFTACRSTWTPCCNSQSVTGYASSRTPPRRTD